MHQGKRGSLLVVTSWQFLALAVRCFPWVVTYRVISCSTGLSVAILAYAYLS